MVINAAIPSFANYNLIKNIESLFRTKFEKINISLSKDLKNEEIDTILHFFENNIAFLFQKIIIIFLKNISF